MHWNAEYVCWLWLLLIQIFLEAREQPPDLIGLAKIGHCVSEVWYDGGWHLLDADESILLLDRDNVTVASEKRVARDHDLAKRSYPGDVLPALYSYDGPHGGESGTSPSRNFEWNRRVFRI